MSDEPLPKSEIIFYQTEDGRTRVEVQFKGETAWLSLNQMAELFQRDKSVISKHIKNAFDEGKLRPEATVAKFATVQTEGNRTVSRDIEFYNLDVIIAVGYRVADAGKPFIGMLATCPGGGVRREDAAIAKNYLTEDELQVLNRIVNLYLEYAELQALERKPMTMRDWVTKLDEFLKISGRKLLDHAGTISAEAAKAKAELEYDRYRALMDSQPRQVDADFEQAVKQIEKLPRPGKPKPSKS